MIRRYARLVTLAATVVLLLWTLGLRWELSKSDWAAWVQAIGSIAAIFAALSIVQVQHQNELRHTAETKRQERRTRLNALKSVFMAVGHISSNCAAKVHGENISWDLEAERFADARRLVQSIPVLDLPDHALVIRLAELAEALDTARAVAQSLNTPRVEKIRTAVAGIIDRTTIICREGIAETTALLGDCSTTAEVDKDFQSYERREVHTKLAQQVWTQMNSETATSAANHGKSSAANPTA